MNTRRNEAEQNRRTNDDELTDNASDEIERNDDAAKTSSTRTIDGSNEDETRTTKKRGRRKIGRRETKRKKSTRKKTNETERAK